MQHFHYRNGELFAEGVRVADVAAEFGTPTYLYSRAAIEERYRAYTEPLQGHRHLICYAVKANSSLAVLNLLARQGAGFDIVSGGELERVLAAGGDPRKVVFSGVGKSAAEIRQALHAGIACFNVESRAELERLDRLAGELGFTAPVSLRVNPDVDARTHPYISTGLRDNKFGIAFEDALDCYRLAASLPHLRILGVDCHIGSQLTDTAPFLDALRRVLTLVDQLAGEGITIEHLDIGGGLGVRYRDEQPPSPADYVAALRHELGGRALTLVFEPGRSIVANAGLLLMRVEYLKPGEHRNFAVVDAAMNDMLRPALYDAWMELLPVRREGSGPRRRYDVVGPVCETGDFLARDRELAVNEGDLLALASSGAYGFTMSSNYNSRGRAAEVMVDGDSAHLVRARETIADLMRGETILP